MSNNSDKENQDRMPNLLTNKRTRKGPAERMWAPVKLNLNDEYHYVSQNVGLRFLYYIVIIFGMPFIYLYYKIRYRFKVINKENLEPVKKKSAVTVSNHVHNTDALMVSYLFYPNTPYFIALRHNLEAFLMGGLVRIMRAVPLPEDIKSFEAFYAQISEVLRCTNRKVHIFPEAEIAPYSRQLREFKNGAFHIAVKNDVPIVPITIVFPQKKRIKMIVGKPVKVQDVPGADGLSEPKQVVMYKKYIWKLMDKTMRQYYAEKNIDVTKPASK